MLMKEMWLSKENVITPYSFKTQLELFANEFVGTRQQDAQELLA